MFPQLTNFADAAFLLLRLMVGLVFASSGWMHLKDPEGRSKSIGASKGVTIFLGVAQVSCALGVLFGILTQLAAAGLALIMLGAIQKKIFVWKTGIWGKHGTDGWHYDLMLLVMNLTIIVTNGGSYVLWR
jgi:putative oxidoreductase